MRCHLVGKGIGNLSVRWVLCVLQAVAPRFQEGRQFFRMHADIRRVLEDRLRAVFTSL